MYGKVLWSEVKEFSIVPVVYLRGVVSILSLVYFLSVGYSSKHYHPHFPLFIGARHIQEYFKIQKEGKQKLIKPH